MTIPWMLVSLAVGFLIAAFGGAALLAALRRLQFNQRAYELFLQPFVQATSNEFTAKLRRRFHPLRWQRWMLSELSPQPEKV